jgi:hypothetical protein
MWYARSMEESTRIIGERFEAWCRKFNEGLLHSLRRSLAERWADVESEYDDPLAQRYYAGEIYLLHVQIRDIEKRLQPPEQSTLVVNAVRKLSPAAKERNEKQR